MSITVDHRCCRAKVAEYLRSSEGRRLLKEFDSPLWLGLVGSVIFAVVGLVQLLTIRWAANGARTLWYIATLGPLRDYRSEVHKNPALFRPLVCHSVIVNAPGRPIGLMLGSFSDSVDHVKMAKVARRLGELYVNGSRRTENQAMIALLRDDVYRPYRRRPLAPPFDRYGELILFDVLFSPCDGKASPNGTMMHAFVAIEGAEGQPIRQIPWAVVDSCVRCGDPPPAQWLPAPRVGQ